MKLAELLEQQQKITDVVGLLLNIFITEPVLQNEGRQWGEEFRWATEAPQNSLCQHVNIPKVHQNQIPTHLFSVLHMKK